MPHTFRRPAVLFFTLGVAALLTAATQGQKFPGGLFKATDPDNNTIALDFDSTGALNVYVNNQAFSQGAWQVKADTLTIGKIQGPDGYGCTSESKYLWAIAENRITFTGVGTDDCQVRRDAMVGLVWTKG